MKFCNGRLGRLYNPSILIGSGGSDLGSPPECPDITHPSAGNSEGAWRCLSYGSESVHGRRQSVTSCVELTLAMSLTKLSSHLPRSLSSTWFAQLCHFKLTFSTI